MSRRVNHQPPQQNIRIHAYSYTNTKQKDEQIHSLTDTQNKKW